MNMAYELSTRLGWASCILALVLILAPAGQAAEIFAWQPEKNRVDADLRDWPLPKLLERIAATTGWQVYVEPGATHTASAKFTDLPVSEALRRLLGDLNFALVPLSNASPRLLVFKTSLGEATQRVGPLPPTDSRGLSGKPIPNELVVTLKPGAQIEELAQRLGARVVRRIPGLNAYRLEFEDGAAAQAARAQLSAHPDVAAVDSNYYVDAPPTALPMLASSLGGLQLRPRAPGQGDRIIIGLIDTAVQPLGGELDGFLLPAISVAGEAPVTSARPTHGTSMAETILTSLQAATRGSSAVQILPVDVYGPGALTTTFEVAAGIYQAVNAGANPINLSLGSEGNSELLRSVIQQARRQGVLFFAAAGNQPVTTPTYPAAYPEVIAVTAGDRKGNIAEYANRGSFVDLVAPGVNVIYFNDQPYFVSGTSAATAFASGLAAGLAETQRQSLTQVETALRSLLAVNTNALR